ncbi:hypothetical protein GCM10008927_21110 [Amylibacter ulvae]|uniref:Lysoplasmalogenase n=1 Tax=Paramylibacter ulvae TaxID=1651968 RepID=A0ABQ3D2C3_9RHOB|nr:lysoplasmalogenase [Amylibacter ulvae]GHA55040.1 hypothetical protein GCM10008927_21110 [Amylibacter ulvae]
MDITILIGISALLAVIQLLFFCYRDNSFGKTLTKTSSILFLLIFAILTKSPILFIIGLGLCAAGDYLLSRDGDKNFLMGVGAFALGHLFYAALFITHPLPLFDVIGDGLGLKLLAAIIAIGALMGVILWRRTGELKIPVTGYVIIICLMGMTSLKFLGLDRATIILGVGLFMASDIVLALEKFVLGKDSFWRVFTPFIVWATYWGAQFFLTFGVIYAYRIAVA